MTNMELKKLAAQTETTKLMISCGWYLFDACTCNNILTYKYKHQIKTKYQVDVHIKKNSFIIWGKAPMNNYHITNLKSIIENL